MDHYVTEVDPSLVYMRGDGSHSPVTEANARQPHNSAAHTVMPVDYSMYNQWHHQQQQHILHNNTSSTTSHATAASTTTTTVATPLMSNSLQLHQAVQQQQQHSTASNHGNLHDNHHRDVLSGLATIGGLMSNNRNSSGTPTSDYGAAATPKLGVVVPENEFDTKLGLQGHQFVNKLGLPPNSDIGTKLGIPPGHEFGAKLGISPGQHDFGAKLNIPGHDFGSKLSLSSSEFGSKLQVSSVDFLNKLTGGNPSSVSLVDALMPGRSASGSVGNGSSVDFVNHRIPANFSSPRVAGDLASKIGSMNNDLVRMGLVGGAAENSLSNINNLDCAISHTANLTEQNLPANSTGLPDFRMDATAADMLLRNAIGTSTAFGGLSRNSMSNGEDFFNKTKPAPAAGVETTAIPNGSSDAAAFDMSISVVNNLLRVGGAGGLVGRDLSVNSSNGNQVDGSPGISGTAVNTVILKQEIVGDLYGNEMDTNVHYPVMQGPASSSGVIDALTSTFRSSNNNAGFLYDDNYGGCYNRKPLPSLQQEHQQQISRIKLDPFGVMNSTENNTNNITNSGEQNLDSFPRSNYSSSSNANNNSQIRVNNGEFNSPSVTPAISSAIVNEQEIFSCPVCTYKTPRKNYLKQHLRTHTGEGKVSCPICSYSTVWRQRLKHHILNHGKEKKPKTQIRNRNSCVVNLDGVVHQASGGSASSENTTADGVGDGKRYYCDYCKYSTLNKNYLRQHTKTHTGDGTISCPHCSYETVWKQRMKRHVMSHQGEKESSCTHCSYSTFDKEKLARHIEAHGDEIYNCSICPFKTQRKTYMKQHMRTHTGEGKVKCPHCQYQTVWKQRLKLHIKKHTDEGGSNEAEGGSLSLKKTAKIHCPHCDFKTCRKDRLRNHMRVHNDGMFSCEMCPYMSASADLLRHHVQTHTPNGSGHNNNEDFVGSVQSNSNGFFNAGIDTINGIHEEQPSALRSQSNGFVNRDCPPSYQEILPQTVTANENFIDRNSNVHRATEPDFMGNNDDAITDEALDVKVPLSHHPGNDWSPTLADGLQRNHNNPQGENITHNNCNYNNGENRDTDNFVNRTTNGEDLANKDSIIRRITEMRETRDDGSQATTERLTMSIFRLNKGSEEYSVVRSNLSASKSQVNLELQRQGATMKAGQVGGGDCDESENLNEQNEVENQRLTERNALEEQ